MNSEHQQGRRIPVVLIIVLTLVVIGVGVTGYAYFVRERANLDQAARNGLSSLADSRAEQIAQWFAERIGDGEVLRHHPGLGRQVDAFVKNPGDLKLRTDIDALLTALHTSYGYLTVSLVDTRGIALLSIGNSEADFEPVDSVNLRKLRSASGMVLRGFSRSAATNATTFAFLAPLSIDEGMHARFIGAIALEIELDRALGPMMIPRLSPGSTIEPMLIGKDSGNAVVINGARLSARPPLSIRVPLDSIHSVEVMSALGMEGIVTGTDYRGQEVTAAIKNVRGTPWHFLAKLDHAEMHSSVATQQWIATGGVMLILLLGGMSVLLWWRSNESKVYRRQYETEIERRALVEHFSSLLKFAGDIIFLLDEEMRIVDANDQASKSYGYSREEFLGMHMWSLRAPNTLGERDDQFSPDRLERGTLFESVHVRKDGSTFPVEINIRAIIVEGTRYYQKIIRDITDRKQTEDALRESEKRFRILSDASFEGIAIAAGGFVLDVNQRIADMLGYTIGEMIDRPVTDFVAPESLERVASKFLENSEEPYEHFALRKDGTKILVEARARSASMGGNNVRITAIRDIGERRKSEQSILMLTKAVQTSGEVIFLTDREGIITFVNDAFTRTYGYSASDVVGKTTPRILKSGQVSREGYARLWSNLLKGDATASEFVNKAKDGTLVEVEASANPIKDEHGEIIGFLAFQRDIRARKQADQMIADALNFNRAMLDASPLGIIAYRSTGEVISANQASARIFDLPLEAVKKQNFRTIQAWNTSGLTVAAERALAHGSGQDLEVSFQTPVGRQVHLACHLERFQYEDQPHLLSVFIDVTERKRSEKIQDVVYRVAQAAASAQHIDDLFDSIHTVLAELINVDNFFIALYDEQENTISFPYFVDEVDTPPTESTLGKSLTAYVLHTGLSLLCDQHLFNRMVERGDVELVGEASPIWLGVPLKIGPKVIGVMVVQDYKDPHAYGDREKEILEFVSSQVARAIDRKRAEIALASQQSYFQQLFEQSPAAIAMLDPTDQIVNINKSFQEMFSYTREEVLSRDIDAVLADELIRDEAVTISEETQRGRLVRAETRRMRKDGSLVPVRVTAYPILVAGKRVGAYAIYEDISEQKRLESQVLHSQKMESLGTLAGGIAHDFNNILAIILGHASIIRRREPTPEKLKSAIEAITKATERGASLVRQLLTFARKTDSLFESVRVNDLIRELLHLLRETFPRTIVIESELEDGVPSVVADASQLHQVLLNVCVNARDAMPVGGTLTVRTSTVPLDDLVVKFPGASEGRYLEIALTDTGTGMDEATQARIFEPFFTTKGHGKGTGLGMALVYGIVENHKGFIDMESSVGKGTTFRIFLPVPPIAAEPRVEIGVVANIPGGTETILVVEDEEMLRSLVQAVLEQKGYKVLTADDGEAAVAMFGLHRREIALVLSDVGLPKFSGIQVFESIRKMMPGIRVIIASGYLEPEQKKEIFAAGVRDFIQKPYDVEDMLIKIRHALDTP